MSKQPRTLSSVIDRIISVLQVCGTDVNYHGLESIKESALYSSPEGMHLQWQRLGEWCEQYVGYPDKDWKILVQNIVMGKTDD